MKQSRKRTPFSAVLYDLRHYLIRSRTGRGQAEGFTRGALRQSCRNVPRPMGRFHARVAVGATSLTAMIYVLCFPFISTLKHHWVDMHVVILRRSGLEISTACEDARTTADEKDGRATLVKSIILRTSRQKNRPRSCKCAFRVGAITMRLHSGKLSRSRSCTHHEGV